MKCYEGKARNCQALHDDNDDGEDEDDDDDGDGGGDDDGEDDDEGSGDGSGESGSREHFLAAACERNKAWFLLQSARI